MCQTFFPTAISFSRKITDARGRSVAWVYYRREGALGAEYLTRDQAMEMAKPAVMVNQPLTARRYGRQS